MTAAVVGNVIPFLGRSWSDRSDHQATVDRTAREVAALPSAELLDAAHLSLTLARLQPGTAASYGRCVKALLCLTRLADECKPAERAGARHAPSSRSNLASSTLS